MIIFNGSTPHMLHSCESDSRFVAKIGWTGTREFENENNFGFQILILELRLVTK